jgi:hypothetical protein
MQIRRTDGRRQVWLRGPGREIALAVAVKLVALGVIYVLFFGPDQRPTIDADRVRDSVIGPVSASSDSTSLSVADEVHP